MAYIEEIRGTTARAIYEIYRDKIDEVNQTIYEFALAGKYSCSVNFGKDPDPIIRYFREQGFNVYECPEVGEEFSNITICW